MQMNFQLAKHPRARFIFVIVVLVMVVAALALTSSIVRVNVTTSPVSVSSHVLDAILDGATPGEIGEMLHAEPSLLDEIDPFFGGPIDWALSSKESDRVAVLEIFLEHGVNPNQESQHLSYAGETPMYTAIAVLADADMVRVLLRHGASTTSIDKEGHSAFELAELEGHEKIIELLRE